MALSQPSTSRINVWGEPACGSCIWGITGALFPAERKAFPGGCPQPVPKGEVDRRINRYVVDFTDPSGVDGTGQPSGGSEPAVGAVVFDGSAAMLTCVLPAGDLSICNTSVREFTSYELGLKEPGGVLVRTDLVIHGS